MEGSLPGGGVKVVPIGAPVEVETRGTAGDVMLLTLQRGHVDVEEVTCQRSEVCRGFSNELFPSVREI